VAAVRLRLVDKGSGVTYGNLAKV